MNHSPLRKMIVGCVIALLAVALPATFVSSGSPGGIEPAMMTTNPFRFTITPTPRRPLPTSMGGAMTFIGTPSPTWTPTPTFTETSTLQSPLVPTATLDPSGAAPTYQNYVRLYLDCTQTYMTRGGGRFPTNTPVRIVGAWFDTATQLTYYTVRTMIGNIEADVLEFDLYLPAPNATPMSAPPLDYQQRWQVGTLVWTLVELPNVPIYSRASITQIGNGTYRIRTEDTGVEIDVTPEQITDF